MAKKEYRPLPDPLVMNSGKRVSSAPECFNFRRAEIPGLLACDVCRLFGAEGIGGAEFPPPDTPAMGDGVGCCIRTGKHAVMPIDRRFAAEFIRHSAGA